MTGIHLGLKITVILKMKEQGDAKLSSTPRDMASIIYEDIKDRILDLSLEPGSPISESEICDRYEASRTPVRTALHRLADKNLIDLLPYQQSRVSLIDLEAVKEFIYARVAIESSVIRDFIDLDQALLIEDVNHLIRKQEIILNDSDFKPQDFYYLDVAMHEVWFRAVNKLAIWKMFNVSTDYIRVRILDIKEEKDYQAILADHKELVDVIRNKQIDSVYPIIDRHLNGGLYRIEARMDDKIRKYFK